LAQRLLDLEAKQFADPLAVDETAAALRGGAAVLMVAALELFLKNLLIECVERLDGDLERVPFDQLPEPIRVRGTVLSLERAMSGPRYGGPKGEIARHADVVAAATRIASKRLDPAAFGDTKSNPGPDTVREMFKNVGLVNIFALIRPEFDATRKKPETTEFLADKLDEIVKRRHRVAHSADALSVSRQDLSEANRFLVALVQALDSKIELHLAAIRTGYTFTG
jgi:hypothetical protein